jgi:hypothetical protein
MALFGTQRDVSLIRHLNRELMGNIITQQASFYSIRLKETKVNMYGEAAGGYLFEGPFIFNCLVQRTPQMFQESDMILETQYEVTFRFLRDDLVDANVVPKVGDYILYEDNYHIINDLYSNQYFVGKNPDYPNEQNPLNPGLANYGNNLSTICITNIVPADRVGITKERYNQ